MSILSHNQVQWAARRGTLELDLLLMPFAKDCYPMLQDAEKFKADDDIQKQRVETRNELESFLYQSKNSAQSIADESTKTEMITYIEEKIDWLDSNQTAYADEYKSILEQVQAELMKFQQQQQPQQEPVPANQQDDSAGPGPTIEEVD